MAVFGFVSLHKPENTKKALRILRDIATAERFEFWDAWCTESNNCCLLFINDDVVHPDQEDKLLDRLRELVRKLTERGYIIRSFGVTYDLVTRYYDDPGEDSPAGYVPFDLETLTVFLRRDGEFEIRKTRDLLPKNLPIEALDLFTPVRRYDGKILIVEEPL